MFFSLDKIISWLMVYKYEVLFPIAVAEGPIVTILGGFLSSLGYLNLFAVFAVVLLGDIVGDIIYYSLGRFLGRKCIEKYGHYIGFHQEYFLSFESKFEKHSGKTLIISKITHFFGGYFLVIAGITKMPFLRFVFFSFIGTLPKSLLLLLVGFYFGKMYVLIDNYFNDIGFALAGLVLLFVCVHYGLKIMSKRLLKR